MTSGLGLQELCARFKADGDDYNAIMAEAIDDPRDPSTAQDAA